MAARCPELRRGDRTRVVGLAASGRGWSVEESTVSDASVSGSATAVSAPVSDMTGAASNSGCRGFLLRRFFRFSSACLEAALRPLLGIGLSPKSRSGPRMGLIVLCSDVFACEVCVHLGRGDAGVTKKLLDVPERRTAP